MKNFNANVARAEMSILADSLKRAERMSDYESGHYNELKRQLEKRHEQVIDFMNM